MGKLIHTVLMDFPESLTSILFVLTKVTVINSTVFKSPNLSSVTSLAIANSGIMRIEPGAFSAFQNLSKLSLYHNNLTTVLASWFSNPGHLENLTVSLNSIKEVGPYMLSSFSNLTTLNLANNKIHMIAVESLRNLSKLKFLDLSGNNLSVLKRDIFSGLRSPSMKLGHNPWDCSCELQDFGAFVQELLNTSLLEDASSITCHNPVTLKGFPVWNISDFGCQPTFLPGSLGNILDKTMIPIILVCVVLLVILWLLLMLWKVKHNRVQGQPGEGPVSVLRRECIKPWESRGHRNVGRQVTIKGMTSQSTTARQTARSALASLSSSEHLSGNLGPSEQALNWTLQLELTSVESGSLRNFYHHNKKLSAPGPQASMELSRESSFCMSEPVKQGLHILEMRNIEERDAWGENSEDLEYFTVSVKSSCCPNTESHGTVQNKSSRSFLFRRSQTWPQEGRTWFKEQSHRTDMASSSVKVIKDELKSAEIYDLRENPKPLSKRTSEPRITRNLVQLGGNQRTTEFTHRQGKVGQEGTSAPVSLRSNVSSLENTQSFGETHALSCDLLHEVVENHGRWTREHWKQTHQARRVGGSLKGQHLPLPPPAIKIDEGSLSH